MTGNSCRQNEVNRRKAKFKTLAGQCSPEKTDIPIVFREGVPFQEILKAVEDEKADFLIFGHKGRTDNHGFSFGTTAEKIFRHCPVPVMSLRG
ncbi:MAG: universal stress protein [Thermodesulfobacteriota bacterium]|nr:universal stress protein [Thermodesulfobacteriota bacterium]